MRSRTYAKQENGERERRDKGKGEGEIEIGERGRETETSRHTRLRYSKQNQPLGIIEDRGHVSR